MPAMSDKLYDILKWMVLIVIPSLTTFYCICDGVFGWGYSDIVSKLSAGFCACVGAIIGISTAQYNKTQQAPIYGESVEDQE